MPKTLEDLQSELLELVAQTLAKTDLSNLRQVSRECYVKTDRVWASAHFTTLRLVLGFDQSLQRGLEISRNHQFGRLVRDIKILTDRFDGGEDIADATTMLEGQHIWRFFEVQYSQIEMKKYGRDLLFLGTIFSGLENARTMRIATATVKDAGEDDEPLVVGFPHCHALLDVPTGSSSYSLTTIFDALCFSQLRISCLQIDSNDMMLNMIGCMSERQYELCLSVFEHLKILSLKFVVGVEDHVNWYFGVDELLGAALESVNRLEQLTVDFRTYPRDDEPSELS
ncbi:hypothetical protein CBER1_02537 [Lecanosticta acicola]|uniref:F-box domain-containing protein n=1 Tax=Lecanosticta acicola TaxID=111012 RepID=A0AAI8YRL1_9PEZI|nr:hypothetical protein CBER1_02537 [Lecanosticta acicola]